MKSMYNKDALKYEQCRSNLRWVNTLDHWRIWTRAYITYGRYPRTKDESRKIVLEILNIEKALESEILIIQDVLIIVGTAADAP